MTMSFIALQMGLLINVALGVLVYWTNTKRLVNQHFLTLSVVIGAWLGCIGAAFTSTRPEDAVFWIKQSSVAAAFVPLAFNWLRVSLVEPNSSWLKVIFDGGRWLFLTVVIGIMCQTPFFLAKAVIPAGRIPEPIYGPGFLIYNAWFLGACIFVIAKYIRNMMKSEGILRTELQFVLLGWGVCCLVGATFALILPLLAGSSQSAQFAPLCVILLDLIIAYGIATRRIMDVPYVLRRITAYGLLAGYLTVLYFVVLYPAHLLAQYMHSDPHSIVPNLLAALAVAFSVAPAHGRMQNFANRLFVNAQSLDVSETIQQANRILGSITTLDDLLEQFSQTVARAVGTDHVAILLSENSHFVQRYPKPTAVALEISATDPIIATLGTDREPLVSDVLQRIQPNPLLTSAGRRMAELRSAVAVGIQSKSGIDGVMLLGPRLSGRIYGAQEQRALQILCNNLAVALENAKLYTQVQDGAIYNDILLDNLVSGIIAVNASRVVTVFNREAQRITRLDAAQVLGQGIERLPYAIAQALGTTFETGTGPRDQDVSLRLGDGPEDTPIRLGSALFHSHTGKVLGALLVFNDLSTLKKLEQQVRRTDRLASLGTLSAGMAHEIKNPLVTLKTFTQLLPERYEDPDFRETFSTLLGQEVRRIDTLVNQLLRFARPTKPSLAPMHLHEVVENTLKLVLQQLRQKGVTLSKDLHAESDWIMGDADLLVQALLNFLLNAIDAMENRGELTVNTEIIEHDSPQMNSWGQRASDSYLRLSIKDTGKGIKPDDISHVFDPFFTTKSTGTGLGLSVAHGIILEHHGLIDVESKVGAGTTFYLLFPLARKEAAV